MAFPELHSQVEAILYDDDNLLPCNRTKGIGNVKDAEEWEIPNAGNMLVLLEWQKAKKLGIFSLSLLRGIIGSNVCK